MHKQKLWWMCRWGKKGVGFLVLFLFTLDFSTLVFFFFILLDFGTLVFFFLLTLDFDPLAFFFLLIFNSILLFIVVWYLLICSA